jgi:hypothetical protein
MFLRKNKMITLGIEALDQTKMVDQPVVEKDIDAIKLIIDSLPNGYKIIFNLYVVEGFKHKEMRNATCDQRRNEQAERASLQCTRKGKQWKVKGKCAFPRKQDT